jgi:hypothetical protein
MLMGDSDEKPGLYRSPIKEPEERKVAESNHTPHRSRITHGVKDIQKMLQTN